VRCVSSHFGGRRLAGMLIALLVLAACGSATKSTAVTVTLWSWRAQDAGLWQKVEHQLQAQGTNIHIAFVAKSPEKYDQLLRSAIVRDGGPDLFYNHPGAPTVSAAAAGLIKPLDDVISLTRLDPTTLPPVRYRDQHYGVPLTIHVMAILYNQKLFEQHHLGVPRTWNELLTSCNTLQSAGVQPFYAMGAAQQWQLALSTFGVGASTVSNQWAKDLVAHRAQYTSPPWVRTLKKFKQLSKYFEPAFITAGSQLTESEESLAAGRAAMIFDSTASAPEIMRFNHNLALGAFLVPADDSDTVAKLPGPSNYWEKIPKAFWYPDSDLAMSAKIRNPDVVRAARNVIDFSTSRQFGDWLSGDVGEVSGVKGVRMPNHGGLPGHASHWFETNRVDPSFGVRGTFDIPPPEASLLSPTPSETTVPQGIYFALQSALVAMLLGQRTPEQAAADIQQAISWYYQAR
jgi:raffinose/stachyose/melibiose transport system substrate-binding protein